jgi:hypothetical protein
MSPFHETAVLPFWWEVYMAGSARFTSRNAALASRNKPAKQALRSFGMTIKDGALAQLVERLHGMQEVSGSTPLSSTNFQS